jgi:hypothetical protein
MWGIRKRYPPATHHIGITTEDFGKTADDYVCVRQDLNIDKVPYCLVDDDEEVIFISQGTETR